METFTLPSGKTLSFDPEAHRYFIGDEECPGSHHVMERYEITEPMNEWARPYVERGSRVHLATEQWDLGEFDESCEWAKSPEMKYLDAWKLFHKDHPEFGKATIIEGLRGSEEAWYATKIDRTYAGNKVVEIKTGSPYKYHPVQLALQSLLLVDCGGAAHTRHSVYLADDGTYTLKNWEEGEDAVVSWGVAESIYDARSKVRAFNGTRRKPVKNVRSA